MQTGELIIIAIVALIVLGPRRLPDIARRLGMWTAELRQAARDITRGLEAEVEDLRQVRDDIRDDIKAPLDEMKKSLEGVEDEISSLDSRFDWNGPKPISGPTPEDAMRDLEELESVDESDTSDPGDDDDR